MCRVRGEKKRVARSNIRQEENINGSIRWWIDCFLFFFFKWGFTREFGSVSGKALFVDRCTISRKRRLKIIKADRRECNNAWQICAGMYRPRIVPGVLSVTCD